MVGFGSKEARFAVSIAMPLKTEAPEDPGINLTPMVDVVFLLVIFFMVGTQFAEHEKHHDIRLPTVSDARPLTSLPDEIVINVTREGEFLVGRVPHSLDELQTALREAHARYSDQIIMIRGDEETQYRAIMTIINACQQAGLANIKLAGRPLQEGRR